MTTNSINFSNIGFSTIYGKKLPIAFALNQTELATRLVNGWETEFKTQQQAIKAIFNATIQIITVDGIKKVRKNPGKDWVKINSECIRILFDAGILHESSVYDQVSKALGKNVSLNQLVGVLNNLTTPQQICEAFEVFADRWIVHEFKDTYHVSNKNVDESVLELISAFVTENTKYIQGRFHYDFQLRSIAGHEDETKGESIADLRESVIHGKPIADNGDVELSTFELNDIYLKSEASYAQDKIDSTGYHNPKIIGLMLARMFNPYIIVKSMEKVVGSLTIEEAEAYLSHRGNDILLENLQNAQDLWEAFHENFDFSSCSAREAFKQMIDFLHINSKLLTEEGLAVLKSLQTYIAPMLNATGVYEHSIKEGRETIVSYDQFFEDQLNRFGQLMAQPYALPATVRAFLVDGMYGAGKRRIATDLYETEEIFPDFLEELDAHFNKSYERYNQDGSLDELLKQESERKSVDSQLADMSLDAIREAGGDEATWEDFISDGTIDPTWEAILEMEGLGAI